MIATRTVRFRLRKSADPVPSLIPPEPVVPDEITGLSWARHLTKLVRK
jgi:hypothetical protein